MRRVGICLFKGVHGDDFFTFEKVNQFGVVTHDDEIIGISKYGLSS